MISLLFWIRALVSIVAILLCYMWTDGVSLFFLAGLVVASVLMASQYGEHKRLKHHPVMYVFVYLFDIVLWPSAIYINIRQAYERRAST